MARIPDEAIERIKAETDLVALVQSRGVVLKQAGTNWLGYCPFHQDKETANLIVTPGKGLFRCMAAGCGATGNAIQFVEKFDGVSFRHAFEVLAGGNAFTSGDGVPKKHATIPKLACPLEENGDDSALLEQVADYYAKSLQAPENQPARDYLISRGLDDPELWRRFGIGFSDRTLGLGIPHKNRHQGAKIRERLQAVGVYRDNGREHLRGCIVIPIRNAAGRVVQLYGRRIGGQTAKEMRHLYLARPLGGVFNFSALKSREIILTESLIDALTFIQNGLEATCTYGTKNFTPELFEAIRTAKIQSVKLAFDADEAGEIATAEATKRLQSIGIECHQIKLPWGFDANSFTQEHGGEALLQAVRSAEWLGGKSPQKPEVSSATSSIVASSLAANLVAKEESSAPSVPAISSLVVRGEHHELQLGNRSYRVGGLEKNPSLEVMKITLRLMESSGLMHVDSLDLYRDGERRKFIDRAAEETGLTKDLLKRDLGKLLLALEQSQEQRIAKIAAENNNSSSLAAELSGPEKAAALELLRSPNLLERITQAYDAAGLVGEQTNLLAAYLACTSRKLAKPLAIIIQSTSAAGKSTLMEAVLSFFPQEDQVKYSAMTGQSLYYLGESNLKHKILAIVEEEGAEKASYALKLLQSEGELTIASTGKDPHSGRMETQEYHVEGPVAIVFTTTSIDIDEELMNRCLVLTVDESQAQTQRIHQLQREARTLEGILAAEARKDILRVMQNAQRLIVPMKIANPFARELTFTTTRTRTRRDHEKYLTLIDTIALLHQHQRQPITREIHGREVIMLPVTLADIEAANRLAPEVLGRSLDELPPQTRLLLEQIKTHVLGLMETQAIEQKLCRFTRKAIREISGWSETQTRLHLQRLEDMEFIRCCGGKFGAAMSYELLTDATAPDVLTSIGLIDPATLKASAFPEIYPYDDQPRGEKAHLAPPSRGGLGEVFSHTEYSFEGNLAEKANRTSGAEKLSVVA
jgi:DNA primase